jgi:hypothetical protein
MAGTWMSIVEGWRNACEKIMYCTFLPKSQRVESLFLKSILGSNFKVDINHSETTFSLDGTKIDTCSNDKTVVILPNNSVAIK